MNPTHYESISVTWATLIEVKKGHNNTKLSGLIKRYFCTCDIFQEQVLIMLSELLKTNIIQNQQ